MKERSFYAAEVTMMLVVCNCTVQLGEKKQIIK